MQMVEKDVAHLKIVLILARLGWVVMNGSKVHTFCQNKAKIRSIHWEIPVLNNETGQTSEALESGEWRTNYGAFGEES